MRRGLFRLIVAAGLHRLSGPIYTLAARISFKCRLIFARTCRAGPIEGAHSRRRGTLITALGTRVCASFFPFFCFFSPLLLFSRSVRDIRENMMEIPTSREESKCCCADSAVFHSHALSFGVDWNYFADFHFYFNVIYMGASSRNGPPSAHDILWEKWLSIFNSSFRPEESVSQ